MSGTGDYRTLPVGAKVVFCASGAYQNLQWYFGVVAAKPKSKAPYCQFVETERVVLDSDPIIAHTRVSPIWERPPAGELHLVRTGRGRNAGQQWLAGFGAPSRSMSYIPIFAGPYEENRSYVDCNDSP